ncbi:MAG: sulfatase-like hydrolase/transferase [Chloroflexi bacterium]|nr:sulfatase-like hydrolase/transferase [Chloroflexota bacterium]
MGLLGFVFCGNVLSSQALGGKPNVLLIFADDQGSVGLGCYGSKDLQTPNLDGLTTKGVRFSQFGRINDVTLYGASSRSAWLCVKHY